MREPGMPERIDMLVNDVQAHAKTLTELTKTLIEIEKRDAVEAESKRHLTERLDRIEKSIAAVYRMGWWVLAAFGAAAVSLVANFTFNGGFIVS
jgi:hypothetical protein